MLSAAHTWSLAAIAVATGMALLWVWKRFSNRERIGLAKRQMRARIYAIRLDAGEPALVLRAQGELFGWTARYLAGMLRPMAIACVPLCILFWQLDRIYGYRPLAAGEAAVVTARFTGRPFQNVAAVTLEGRGAVVETPGVRLPGGREICWRARGPGDVVLRAPGVTVTQAIKCGPGLGYPWPAIWTASPSLEVSCPAAVLDVFGVRVAWPVWFLLVALIAMWTLRGRWGVAL